MNKGDIIYLTDKLSVDVINLLDDSLPFDHFVQYISDRFCPFISASIKARGFYHAVICGDLINTTALTTKLESYTRAFIDHVYQTRAPKHFYCLCICFNDMVSGETITESVSILEATYKRMGVLFGTFLKDHTFRKGTDQAISTPESFVVIRFVANDYDLRFYSDRIPFSKPPEVNPLKKPEG